MKINVNRIYRVNAPISPLILQVFFENPKRKAFLILNNGANIVDFFDNPQGVYGQGFPVAPGQRVSDDHFNPQGELYVTAETCASELCIWVITSEEANPCLS